MVTNIKVIKIIIIRVSKLFFETMSQQLIAIQNIMYLINIKDSVREMM